MSEAVSFLPYLDQQDGERLRAVSEVTEYAPDSVILPEGDGRHAIFLVEEGDARVERNHDQFYVEVARLGAGEIFGEMSFLEGFTASASVVADSPCRVRVFEGEAVQGLLDADPALAARFYRSIAEILSRRLRRTTVEGLAEFSWGGRVEDASATPEGWGGGNPFEGVEV